jgi:multicomponent Na+:H+ antiporter subunit D
VRDHFPILLLILPFLAAAALAGLSTLSSWLSRLVVLAVFVTGWIWGWQASAVVLTQEAWRYHLGGWPAPWGLEIVLTPLTFFFMGWIWFIGMATWFYSLPHWMVRHGESVKEGLFNSFLFLALGSTLGLLLIRDLLGLYLVLEILLAALTGLLVTGQAKNWKEGFDFFFWGSLGASFFLLAAFYLYASTGTLNLDDLLSQIFISKNGAIVLTVGVLLSLSLMPFWTLLTPGLYVRWMHQTPAFVTGFFASVVVRTVAAFFFILLFFTLNLPGFNPPLWLTVLEYVVIFLFLTQFIRAFQQKELQPMLGALSVAQLGTLFAGFLLGTKSALTGTLLELLSQMLSMAGLFYIAGVLRPNAGALPVSRLAGLARQKPWTGLALIVFAASIVGIPPTGGSLGKWYLLQGALEKSNWTLAGFLAAASLLSLFYFTKLVVLLYEDREGSHADSFSPALIAPFLALALGVLFLGVFHQTIIQHFIEPALPKAFQDILMPNVPFLGQQVE